MTRPKPKTVRAWAFKAGRETVRLRNEELAHSAQTVFARHGVRVGPVVRIEVPAPKERKR